MTRTITVGNDKITIIARKKTWKKNFIGYKITVNGIDYFFQLLNIQEAMDKAFSRYVQEYR